MTIGASAFTTEQTTTQLIDDILWWMSTGSNFAQMDSAE